MKNLIKILAISGSTRTASSNLNLIKAIAGLSSDLFSITIFEGLTELPHFNPDMDNESPPQLVTRFRQQINEVQGVLICSPEYAMGVPGSLKNAVDWTVSTMNFSQKPVALITAALSGDKAHSSLLETLLILEAKIMADTQYLISFVKTKVNSESKITDVNTLTDINTLIKSFKNLIEKGDGKLLSEPILMNR